MHCFFAFTRGDMMAFLSGRDALSAELYPHFADLAEDWEVERAWSGRQDIGAPPSRDQEKLEPEVYGGIVGDPEGVASD